MMLHAIAKQTKENKMKKQVQDAIAGITVAIILIGLMMITEALTALPK